MECFNLIYAAELACEYSRLSPLLADGDVSRFPPPHPPLPPRGKSQGTQSTNERIN